ncbi:MAG: ATP-binding cassette domain-containing protein [Myxococcota bacterium]
MRAELDAHVVSAAGAGFALDLRITAPIGITILFGPSGAGKSTTLRAIAGLDRPSAGRIALRESVWFDSERGVDVPVHHRGLAYVFQSLALFPHLTAAENVEFGLDRRLSRDERRALALSRLERMRVPHLADRRPGTFSGGEAQRVALARAFAREPKLVLLDEPFSAMDRELRRELGEEVKRYVEEAQIPAIMVTHHRMDARALGTRMIRLAGGKIAAEGSVDALLEEAERARDEEEDR